MLEGGARDQTYKIAWLKLDNVQELEGEDKESNSQGLWQWRKRS
jgi:hypothetical protein